MSFCQPFLSLTMSATAYEYQMIKFGIKCQNGHSFESWFKSGLDFEKLHKAKLISCEFCGSTDVEKTIMSPRISSKRADQTEKPADTEQMLKKISEYIRNNAEHVDDNFANEARMMHLGESDKRMIVGQTSVKEAKELHDEGIPVAPIPWYKSEVN